MAGNTDLDSFIDWFLSRMKNSSASVVSKSASNRLKVYVIKHDMGENWSLDHKTIIKSIFSDVLQKPIHITTTDSTLTLKFEEGLTF